MNIWIKFLLVCILIILILLMLVSYYAYRKVLKISKRRDYFDEPYLEKRFIEGNMKKIKEYHEHNNYKEINIKSIDNLNLYGRLIFSSKTKFVILVHGYHSISNRLLEFAKFYDELGYSVLLVDLRGHGKSEGKHVGMAYKDSYDIECFIKYLKEQYGENISIILHGFSMGAGTVMNVIRNNDPAIKFAVSDSGFYSMRKVMKYKIRHDYHFPATPIYEFAYLYYVIATGDRYHKMKPIDSVKKTNIPLLIIHGSADDFVTVKHAYKLNEVTNSYHELLIIDGAGHTLSYRTDKIKYEAALRKFIDKFIK